MEFNLDFWNNDQELEKLLQTEIVDDQKTVFNTISDPMLCDTSNLITSQNHVETMQQIKPEPIKQQQPPQQQQQKIQINPVTSTPNLVKRNNQLNQAIFVSNPTYIKSAPPSRNIATNVQNIKPAQPAGTTNQTHNLPVMKQVLAFQSVPGGDKQIFVQSQNQGVIYTAANVQQINTQRILLLDTENKVRGHSTFRFFFCALIFFRVSRSANVVYGIMCLSYQNLVITNFMTLKFCLFVCCLNFTLLHVCCLQ